MHCFPLQFFILVSAFREAAISICDLARSMQFVEMPYSSCNTVIVKSEFSETFVLIMCPRPVVPSSIGEYKLTLPVTFAIQEFTQVVLASQTKPSSVTVHCLMAFVPTLEKLSVSLQYFDTFATW
jgi:hypothetical protein